MSDEAHGPQAPGEPQVEVFLLSSFSVSETHRPKREHTANLLVIHFNLLHEMSEIVDSFLLYHFLYSLLDNFQAEHGLLLVQFVSEIVAVPIDQRLAVAQAHLHHLYVMRGFVPLRGDRVELASEVHQGARSCFIIGPQCLNIPDDGIEALFNLCPVLQHLVNVHHLSVEVRVVAGLLNDRHIALPLHEFHLLRNLTFFYFAFF